MIIYKITNLINGKQYIGQTVNSLKKRFSDHQNPGSHCRALSSALKKYGKENFEIKTISNCISIKEMNYREQYYIKLFNTLAPNGYNLRSGGDNHTLTDEHKKKIGLANKGKTPSIEVKNKISESLKGKYKGLKGKEHPLFGTNLTEERKNKISVASKGKKHSEESKIKASLSKNSKKVKVYCLETNIVYDSINYTSLALKIPRANIFKVLNGERKTAKGYTFKRVSHEC